MRRSVLFFEIAHSAASRIPVTNSKFHLWHVSTSHLYNENVDGCWPVSGTGALQRRATGGVFDLDVGAGLQQLDHQPVVAVITGVVKSGRTSGVLLVHIGAKGVVQYARDLEEVEQGTEKWGKYCMTRRKERKNEKESKKARMTGVLLQYLLMF